MKQSRHIPIAMLLTVAIILSGCRANPDVRKHRYLESGKRFSAEGRYREASIQYLNALKVDQDFGDAHYQLAQAYEHMGQFKTASQELERAIDADPDNLAARVDYGNLLLAGGRVSVAREEAHTVLTAQPGNPGVHALLSAIASRQGQNALAIQEIRRAIKLDPNRAAFHENLGLLLSDNPANEALAEAEFRKAIELEPKSLNARLLLVSYYARGNRLVAAEKAAWNAVAVDPRSLTARADVAQIILSQGDRARAEKVLRQASQDLSGTAQGAAILADYYASSQQFNKAYAEFSAQLARHPNNAILQKGYARILIQTHNYPAARTVIANLLKYNPKDSEAAALNGVLLLADGKVEKASSALREGARAFPQDAFIQYWLGKAAQADGEPGIAEMHFRQAAALNPLARGPLEELAGLAGQRGDTASLEELANRSIAALPGIPDGYIWRAIVEMDRGSFDQAETDLDSALKVAPQSWQAWLQFGKLRFLQKRYPEGVTLLEHALEHNPNCVQALRLLTDYDISQNRLQQAFARVNTQIRKQPENSSFYDLLAELQIQSNKLDDAAVSAQHAIQLNSSDGDAVSLYAQIAVDRGMTDKAVETWLKWSDSNPKDAGALAILGTLEESRGNIKQADTYYKKSLKLQPHQPIAANNLAYHMLQNDESLDEALNLAETARQAMPDSPNTADTLAWAYYHTGTYESARDLLQDALNDDPDSAWMHYHLGMVYTKLKDMHNAVIQLKKAISLPHDAQLAEQARIALRSIT
jgi:tetratricopeptide (TPR) repeat protein